MLSDDFELLDPNTLATNEVFSDEDRSTLKRLRSVASENLALLNAELALADLSFEDNNTTSVTLEHINRKRRRKLVVLIAASDVAIAPHKSLPTELLSYIFILAFSRFPTYLPPHGRTGTALVVCQTCSRWRSVALDTPDLWADIIFRYEKGLDPYQTADLVVEYFARCGPLKPLSLDISQWSGSQIPANHQEVMQDVLRRLVVPYASRFRNLKLRLPESEIHSFLTMTHLTFPCLKSIHLECDYSSTDLKFRSPASRVLFPANAPLLTELVVYNFRYNLKVDHTFFPWNQLTRLSCQHTSVTIPQIHAILRRCHNLTVCFLNIDTLISPSDFDISKARIRLLSMQQLFLSFTMDDGPLVGSFLEPLYIPNIKELSITNTTFGSRSQTQEALLALLTRSCHNIEILQISDISLSKTSVSNIARILPSLTTLLIGTDTLLPSDTLKGIAAGMILPKLRCLACKVDDLESAIRMLEYRWEASIVSPDAGSDSSGPAFFMLDYIGQVINHDQAVRVDRLRAMGVEITMTRVQS
ncbi:hypothetical protein CVT25_002913 [Psilocybe cyanescens]|uniref:F-box domain-containing protein n=1 Tax=Psilocybe cyanescens TaxID=93625 RepID=A0A409WMX8_PSICY|nr:hypothetical protein CVT25_002913 [Psilocybe cyanescens]